jgi:hypothetical protein
MLSRKKVLQMIRFGKGILGIEDTTFMVKFVGDTPKIGKHAEIFIWSSDQVEMVLYPKASYFSVNHELCHAKLYMMGIPLTNTVKDLEFFPQKKNYMKMVMIVEWYVNELQKQFFQEYYTIDKVGTPRPPPFPNLPELPREKFSNKQINYLTKVAKKSS